MPKTSLEKQIAEATSAFASKVIDIMKDATLQELVSLQSAASAKKPGPKPRKKPGPKPRKKPGPKPRKKPGPKPRKKAGPRRVVKKAKAAPVKKKRVVKNYPKCAFPRCNKNRFVRGKGFCGKHWKLFAAGKIKSAEEYKKKK